MALGVWGHFLLYLDSTGLIRYKFSNLPKMNFHLVHWHFSVSSRWGVTRILVRISAGWSILIMKTSRNSRCWVNWAFKLSFSYLYRIYSVFYNLRILSIVTRYDLGIIYYLSESLLRILPWDPWWPRCSKSLVRSCQDSQDASKRVNQGCNNQVTSHHMTWRVHWILNFKRFFAKEGQKRKKKHFHFN